MRLETERDGKKCVSTMLFRLQYFMKVSKNSWNYSSISATFNMYIIIAFPPIFSIDYTCTEVKISITLRVRHEKEIILKFSRIFVHCKDKAFSNFFFKFISETFSIFWLKVEKQVEKTRKKNSCGISDDCFSTEKCHLCGG